MKNNVQVQSKDTLIDALQGLLTAHEDVPQKNHQQIIQTLSLALQSDGNIQDNLREIQETYELPSELMTDMLSHAQKAQQSSVEHPDIPERYVIQKLLGRGGMGSVYQALDKQLNRNVAIKVLSAAASQLGGMTVERFTNEALIIAQLEHPSIIPIYDAGLLPDGRFFFTMKEVQGIEFGQMIRAVHEASTEGWRESPEGWTFHTLIDILARVSEAVAFAHTKGVLHRDLKPSNIMVGPYGEAILLDWGIAKVIGSHVPEIQDIEDSRSSKTHGVIGTPVYMAPESIQAVENAQPTADVYSLGIILYEILLGAHPFVGQSSKSIILNALQGKYPKLRPQNDTDGFFIDGHQFDVNVSRDGKHLPVELIELSEAATELKPNRRLPTVDLFVAQLHSWLQGKKKQATATSLIERACKLSSKINHIQAELDDIYQSHVEADILPLQAAEQLSQLEHDIQNTQLEQEQLLYAALYQDPQNVQANSSLAQIYVEKIQRGVYSDDTLAQQRSIRRAREHLASLPSAHPVRAQHYRLLKGLSQISIDVPAAVTQYSLYEYPRGYVGPSKIKSSAIEGFTLHIDLKPGSYLLVLHAAGFEDIRIPMLLTAGDTYQHRDQSSTAQQPLRLIPQGQLAPEERFIPAGRFWAKRNRIEQSSKNWKMIWLPDLIMMANPVTQDMYLQFILEQQEKGIEIDPLLPRDAQDNQQSTVLYKTKANGIYALPAHAFPTQAVTGVSWTAAQAYAEWYSQKSGHQWRIPTEEEWMKAARGGDKRIYPWGEHPDQFRFNSRTAQPTLRHANCVYRQKEDISPYGVHGTAGNVIDWTSSSWIDHSGVVSPDKIIKGGSWNCPYWLAQIDLVRIFPTGYFDSTIGFRLCRTIED